MQLVNMWSQGKRVQFSARIDKFKKLSSLPENALNLLLAVFSHSFQVGLNETKVKRLNGGQRSVKKIQEGGLAAIKSVNKRWAAVVKRDNMVWHSASSASIFLPYPGQGVSRTGHPATFVCHFIVTPRGVPEQKIRHFTALFAIGQFNPSVEGKRMRKSIWITILHSLGAERRSTHISWLYSWWFSSFWLWFMGRE